jgi:hypothetical protein
VIDFDPYLAEGDIEELSKRPGLTKVLERHDGIGLNHDYTPVSEGDDGASSSAGIEHTPGIQRDPTRSRDCGLSGSARDHDRAADAADADFHFPKPLTE